MEPVGTFHDGVEVEVGGVGLGNGRVCTVVDDLARTHGGTALKIVDAYAVAAAGDILRLYAVAAQGVDGRLADFVLRQFGYEVGFMTVVGAADGYVGFAAAVNDVETVGLDEAGITRCGESEHDFSESDNLCHGCIVFVVVCDY